MTRDGFAFLAMGFTGKRAAVSNLQKHPQCLRKYTPDGLQ
nr:hypothetical protein [Escherichia coli]